MKLKPREFWIQLNPETAHYTGRICWNTYPGDKPVDTNYILVREVVEINKEEIVEACQEFSIVNKTKNTFGEGLFSVSEIFAAGARWAIDKLEGK
jgi:hypothetical protein